MSRALKAWYMLFKVSKSFGTANEILSPEDYHAEAIDWRTAKRKSAKAVQCMLNGPPRGSASNPVWRSPVEPRAVQARWIWNRRPLAAFLICMTLYEFVRADPV